MFDEKTERAIVQEPFIGQSAKTREGVSRKQVQRFYDRLNAVKAARTTFYTTDKEHCAANVLMGYIENGFTEVEELPKGRIRLKKGNMAYLLQRKVDADFIRVMLDIEPLAKNY